MSIVRDNMLTELNYTPYCGSPRSFKPGGCKSPRMFFNGTQMECPHCGHTTSFEPAFIEKYKAAQSKLREASK